MKQVNGIREFVENIQNREDFETTLEQNRSKRLSSRYKRAKQIK